MSDRGEQAPSSAKPGSFSLPRVSVRARWTLLIAGTMALISLLGGLLIYQQHTRILTSQLVEQGISLARLLAVENADAVLLEDWVGIQMVAEGIGREQVVGYLSITDQQGRMRGSTDPAGVDQARIGLQSGELLRETDDGRVYRVTLPEGEFLHFEVPILFQQAEIGRIHLGLTAPTGQNALLATLIMQGVALVLASGFLSYLLAACLRRPLRILGQALTELVWGRYECRIVENRDDEVGRIFLTFNHLAEFLQHSRITLENSSGDAAETPQTSERDVNDSTVQFDVSTLKRHRSSTKFNAGQASPPNHDPD